MKIVIDARESGRTTGRYVDKLVEYLQQIDRTNTYVVLYERGCAREVTLTAPNFTKVATKYKEFTFGEQLGFAWQLYRLKADLVHFGMIQQPLLYMKKSVTTMHDLTTVRFRNPSRSRLWWWFKKPPYWLVIQIVTRRAKAIITPTNYVMKDIIKYTRHTPRNAHVTSESADLIKEKAEPVAGLERKDFIMYIGRHQPHKNLERLVRAHRKLAEKHPELVLVIAGKKDKATDVLLARKSELGTQNMLLTGFVSEGELRWLYENTLCYVVPSLSEGFGLPGLEAMRNGAPVASSNATCLPEVYGEGAKYFSPYSVEEMAEVIGDIITHKKLRAELIAKGRKQAAKYSWKRMAEETLGVYKEVLGV